MSPRTAFRLACARVSAACALAALAGCTLGPNYERPTVDAPGAYRDGPPALATDTDAARSIADLPWWEVFNDQTLTALIGESLAANYDTRIAVTRIEQARAISLQARSEFFPQVNYDAGITSGKNEFLGTPAPNGGAHHGAALLGINAVWEIDLWGRISRSNEEALALVLASEEARRGVLLSVVSDVAQAYFELLGLDKQLEISRRTSANFNKSAGIFDERYRGGVASKLHLLRAQADATRTAATVSQIERAIALKENQICVLLARNPGPIPRGPGLLDQTPAPDVPVGLPSTLMERRPDLRQAEQFIVAANARVGIADANYFPRIGLTTAFGRVSPDLSQFSSGDSNFWSIGANLAGPLFTGGRLDAQKAQAIAAWEQATLEYQRAALGAFRDVADALAARRTLADERVQTAQTVTTLTEAVKMAGDLYNAGKASYFELLEAQRQLFPAETELARTQTDQLVVVVRLYKALGGGWSLNDEQWLRVSR